MSPIAITLPIRPLRMVRYLHHVNSSGRSLSLILSFKNEIFLCISA